MTRLPVRNANLAIVTKKPDVVCTLTMVTQSEFLSSNPVTTDQCAQESVIVSSRMQAGSRRKTQIDGLLAAAVSAA